MKIFGNNFYHELIFVFRRAVVPELFTRRVQRGEKFYQHGGWKSEQKKKKMGALIATFHNMLNGELVGINYLRFMNLNVICSHMNLN